MTNLMIHSTAEFSSITLAILEAIQAKRVCEVGMEDGLNSKLLHDWLQTRNGELFTISHGSSQVKTADAWFLQGNPNWFSITQELTEIYNSASAEKSPMVIFIHNIGWPAARRDWYPTPERIPESFRQPYSWDQETGLEEMTVMNARGEKKYACAVNEGGYRNGVLTAIEDFVAQHSDEFFWASIPAVFGLGVLFDRKHPQATEISKIVAPYHQNTLLAELERNRLLNYILAHSKMENMQSTADNNDIEINADPVDVAQLEVSIMRILDVLSDEQDHQDVWNIFKVSAEPSGKDSLIALANHMDQLLDLSQPPKIVKILTIAHAVSAAYLGNVIFAVNKLEELTRYYPNCKLTHGALSRVRQLEHVVA